MGTAIDAAHLHRRQQRPDVMRKIAALIIAIVPICIIIAVFQERVVGGLTSGGVKG